VKVGLSRLHGKNGEDLDFLFDEQGNVYTLKGEYEGNHGEMLDGYFKEYEKTQMLWTWKWVS